MFTVILFITAKTGNDQMSVNNENINCDIFTMEQYTTKKTNNLEKSTRRMNLTNKVE